MGENVIFKIKKIVRDNYILILISLVGLVLRVYNLDWDWGFYLHPDERLYVNASSIHFPSSLNELFSPASPLNPDMFYYGTFPLYLYKLVSTYLLPSVNFTITSRLVSALFSTLTIPMVYLVSINFLSKRGSITAAAIMAFAAGSIQYAHFNTTESILVFLLTAILYFSIKLFRQYKYKYIITLGILMGLAYSTKVTGIIFLVLPSLCFYFHFIHFRSYKKLLQSVALFSVAFFVTALIFSFYQIVDLKQFIHEQTYMQHVILGSEKPPFTIIFENTPKYLYPLINVLPFNFGFISFILAIAGLALFIHRFIKNAKGQSLQSFILILPLLYFIWAGGWYAKFSRYYILLFPFLAIWAAAAFERFSKKVQVIILLLIVINGLMFFRIYLSPHTRIEASDWIYKNVPPGSVIVGEHWDDNLPLPFLQHWDKKYVMKQANVYDVENREKIIIIATLLAESDYFIISSRRVSHSVLMNTKIYPNTSRIYNLLENGSIGFGRINTITSYPFIFPDDFADESFQSYDHPPVLIYKNIKKIPAVNMLESITNNE